MILSHFTGRIKDTQEERFSQELASWAGWRQACEVFEETGLDTYRSICLLRDQKPRLMLISLSFVVCVTPCSSAGDSILVNSSESPTRTSQNG